MTPVTIEVQEACNEEGETYYCWTVSNDGNELATGYEWTKSGAYQDALDAFLKAKQL